jgi:voltage-dependent potassium channel beta subunit
MEYRKLGKWGLQVSAISIGNHVDWGKNIPDEQTEAIITRAYEAGVNYFDSAEKYAMGRCEELIGEIINKKGWSRESLVLGTKVTPSGVKDAPANRRGLGRKHLTEMCERSLRTYKTDHLDLFFCHRPDSNVSAEEIVRTMNLLIQQGKILHWGTSDHSPELLLEMHAVARQLNMEGPAMEQTWYNMMGRARIERDLLPLFENYGMGVTAYQPLGGGLLTGKYLGDTLPQGSRADKQQRFQDSLTEDRLAVVRQFKEIADELGVTLAVLALGWALKNPNISTVIAGASRVDQVETNIQAVDLLPRLDQGIMDRIAQIQGDRLQI